MKSAGSARDGTIPPVVLLVEDDDDTREMYALALGMNGLSAATVMDAEEGVSVATEIRPDVIITDIGLPGPLDARAMTRRLRADARTRHIPVIAVTGYEPARVARLGQFRQVLMKPVAPDELITHIEAALQHATRLRQRAERYRRRGAPLSSERRQNVS